MENSKDKPFKIPLTGLCFMNMLWNFALSWAVSGGKGAGGGDLGNDIPVFC